MDAMVVGGLLILATPQGQEAVKSAAKSLSKAKEECKCASYRRVYQPNNRRHPPGRGRWEGGEWLSPGPDLATGTIVLASAVPVDPSEEILVGYDPTKGWITQFMQHHVDEFPICTKYYHGFIISDQP